MFDLQAHIQEQAAWLLHLSTFAGWRQYAKGRRDELLAHPFYGQALRDELNRLQALQTQSESPPSSTPPTGAPCEAHP